VSVVTVAAASTAWVATSSATSVVARAVLTRVIRAVSARILAVRSGVKSQAEAADGRDVDDDDGTTFLLLFVLLGCGDGASMCSCGVSGEFVPCDKKGDGVNASMQRGDITAHSTAILDILAVLAVVVGDVILQHASAASNGLIRVLFLFL